MKVALVHDHLAQDGGAEKVLKVLQELYPNAPTFTLLYNPDGAHPDFRRADIRTSFLQRFPFGVRKYQWYLPLMPLATESYDLMDYDLVISSSSAFAKGVITSPKALHVCYCHTPTRYLWTDTHSYVKELRVPRFVKWIIPPILSRIRMWDRLAADRVDHFVANSHTVQDRIKKYYRRESDLIYPPVELSKFTPKAKAGGDYFLTGGRLVSYKRFDITIKAFNRLGIPLVVFGTGPELATLKKMAKKHITFVGYVDVAKQAELYRNARAFINPQVEDFGITPIESMACGTPVIAFGQGGALETIVDGKTGLFFHEQRWEELSDLIIRFKDDQFNPQKIHQHAQRFDVNTFKQRLQNLVEQRYREHTSTKAE
jgi:glycosyltransferase involved in cell wall biosynthesis